MTVGANSAENDGKFLNDCFVYHSKYNLLTDADEHGRFVYGRTGVGKTAFLRQIEDKQRHVSVINLEEMALSHLTNSDVLKFLDALDVNIENFFLTLWKHALCIEYIKTKYRVDSEKKSVRVFISLRDKFLKDGTRGRALGYLEKYSNKFWIDTDIIVKELTDSVSSIIEIEAGGMWKKFKANANAAKNFSRENKQQVKARLMEFIQKETLSELNHVLSLLKADNNNDEMRFILIDGIDEQWIDESLRYKLIRALIDVQKSLRKLADLKVVVALRADIFERVMQETTEPGQQRDKFTDLIINLKWSEKELKELIDKRITHAYRRKYTSNPVYFSDLFSHNVGQVTAWKYIFSRCQNRPRDIISFVNYCLERAEGNSQVSASSIRSAEKEYSRVRIESLKQEWLSALPSLTLILDIFRSKPARLQVKDLLNSEEIDLLMLRLLDIENCQFDPIICYVHSHWNTWSPSDTQHLIKLIVSEIYRVGFVALKFTKDDTIQYSFKDAPTIYPDEINDESWITVHKAFHSALNKHLNS